MQTLSLSSVLSGLSAALDLTEGHPEGHAARTCLIGMHLARHLGLGEDESSDLFYALLLKDAGCSSNAGRVYQLFGGPEHQVKRAVWLSDWRRYLDQVRYALGYVERGGAIGARLRRLVALAAQPGAPRELFQIRCERSAQIARGLGFSASTAEAVYTMDEHWDGGGHPQGLRGHAIPLAGRIIGLAQVVEIFWGVGGPTRALQVARERRGRWFDPELVDCLVRTADAALWSSLAAPDVNRAVAAVEPAGRVIPLTDARLDELATAFAWVIDAKSSFTYQHSDRTAAIAVAIAHELGWDETARTRLRRAGLLHDIGKLAVPNAILDKPGALSDDEWTAVRLHPQRTLEILARVPAFAELADDAANHHERLDGRGYFRGIDGTRLSPTARILAVADVADALGSARPYRAALPVDEVVRCLEEGQGRAFCGTCVDAARAVLGREAPPSLRRRPVRKSHQPSVVTGVTGLKAEG